MSKQANPTLIGAFVVGAIALLVVAAILFGGSSLFEKKIRFVTYFEGSVQGLRVGSNLTFRGVRVGYVTEVRLQAQIDSLQTLVPVTIEILPGTIQFVDGDRILQQEDIFGRLTLEQLIEAGLRAQLKTESYVTGQLLIDMDLLPEMPAVMRGIDPPYPEIPTIPNNIEQILGNIERLISAFKEKVDIDSIIVDVQGILHGLNEVVNSSDLRDSMAGLNTLINSAETQRLSATITVVAEEIDNASKATRALIDNTDQNIASTARRLDNALEVLQKSVTTLTGQLDGTLKQFDSTLVAVARGADAVDAKLSNDSPLAYELNETLAELKAAARALRIFVDYLEQHPEALLRGKQGR